MLLLRLRQINNAYRYDSTIDIYKYLDFCFLAQKTNKKITLEWKKKNNKTLYNNTMGEKKVDNKQKNNNNY